MRLLAVILLFHLSFKHPVVRVKEHCLIPRIVAKVTGNADYAITVGHTIYVSCDYKTFVSQGWFLKHELQHVRQYERYGFIGFMSRYIWYSIKHGHDNNPLEKEAFEASTK